MEDFKKAEDVTSKAIGGIADGLEKVIETTKHIGECVLQTHKMVKSLTRIFEKTSERMETSQSPTPVKSIFAINKEEENRVERNQKSEITSMLNDCLRNLSKKHRKPSSEDSEQSPKHKSKRKVSGD
jgi:hypothetical protein